MECNYPVTDHELLAIYLACQRQHCYLHGAESTVVYTDHKALVHLLTQPLLNPRQTSWVEKLAEFHLDIQYIAGPANIVANGFLQPPITTKLQLISDPTMHSSLIDWLALLALYANLDQSISAGVSTFQASRMPQTLCCTKCQALHLCHGVFATCKHIEHTCRLCSAVFTQCPAVQANPLVVLGLGLVGSQLAISWLSNLSDIPLAIQSLQSSSIPARARGGTKPCFLELLSGVEAAQCALLVLEPLFLQCVSELTFYWLPNLSPHLAHEFQRVVAYTKAHEPTFVVCKVHCAQLVYYYHPVQPSLELLIIPPGGGLCQLLL